MSDVIDINDARKAEPEPLRAPLRASSPYPVEALGPVLGPAAKALHETVKAPLVLCAQCVLSAASLVVQAHFDVKTPWGATLPTSLFLLTVGESGERKTAIDRVVFGAVRNREHLAMVGYRSEKERYQAAIEGYNAHAKYIRNAGSRKGQSESHITSEIDRQCGPKPVRPIAPHRFVSDPTVEGLYRMLVANQPSVGLITDEGGLLIGGHAMNSDNALRTFARLSKFWSGDAYDRVRAQEDTDTLYGRRLTLHLLAQPEVMASLLSNELASSQGILSRCLVAYPESMIGKRQVAAHIDPASRSELITFHGIVKELIEAPPRTGDNRQELKPRALQGSRAANALSLEQGNRFERLMAEGQPCEQLRDFGSKALEQAWRIAGVLTVMELGMAADEISEDYLQCGITLVRWYLNEMLRLRGAMAVPIAVQDAEALLKWLENRQIKVFRTASPLTQGPNRLRNKDQLMAAIDKLVDCGYLTVNDPGTEVDGVLARKSWTVASYAL